jgi:integrase
LGWLSVSGISISANPGNVLKRHVRPAAESLGILLGGWHDFRHSVATKMLRAGVSPKIVSELLGHADVSITLNTYDHVDLEAFRAPLDHAADQLLRDVTQSGTPVECASGQSIKNEGVW